jgi:hypothetical protein
MNSITGLSLITLSALAARGIEHLPSAPGLQGHVAPTLSAMEFRDNLVAGAGPMEVGVKRIPSLQARPGEESAAFFSLAGELGYFFADDGVYIFAGNRLEDFLRLDNSTTLGARLDLPGVGLLEAGALLPVVPTKVWADPYLTNADRVETDRTSSGARVGLGRISGTGLEANVTLRTVELTTSTAAGHRGCPRRNSECLLAMVTRCESICCTPCPWMSGTH